MRAFVVALSIVVFADGAPVTAASGAVEIQALDVETSRARPSPCDDAPADLPLASPSPEPGLQGVRGAELDRLVAEGQKDVSQLSADLPERPRLRMSPQRELEMVDRRFSQRSDRVTSSLGVSLAAKVSVDSGPHFAGLEAAGVSIASDEIAPLLRRGVMPSAVAAQPAGTPAARSSRARAR